MMMSATIETTMPQGKETPPSAHEKVAVQASQTPGAIPDGYIALHVFVVHSQHPPVA